MIDKQKIWTIVRPHLLSMKRRSMQASSDKGVPICLYRADNGSKCAIGVLIPDNLYSPSMEENSVPTILGDDHTRSSLTEYFKEAFSYDICNEADSLFLNRLQMLHDTSDNWDANGIKFSVLDTFECDEGLQSSES